jgi:hypothetical protein
MVMTYTVNFDSWLPDKVSLYDYQTAGVAYALYATAGGKGAWIADEQGLGKTMQAIVAAKVRGCKKIGIFVKASLKAVWVRELERCAPEWNVQVLTGKRPYEATAEVCIIQFDLLHTWADALVAEQFDCLIIDESHYVKDTKAQRTRAALKVAADVRSRRGMLLLLTGTPLLNRPVELVPQLMMMGRLQDVSPPPRYGTSERDWEYAFKNTYCFSEQNSYGTKYNGARWTDLLNTRMRNSCFVRRLRRDVLDMADAHRVATPLSLNGALDRYWDLEKHFVSKKPESYWLELLGALRKEVGRAKVAGAVDWVKDFLEETEEDGKKVVVWTWHVAVGDSIAKAFPGCANMREFRSGSPEFMAEMDRFNTDPECRVIVCSLNAHREGLTLVGNGHNVTDTLFCEQPWHPGAVSQAEDRISRIGQLAQERFTTTLQVPGTVDEWLANLIAEKWETFKGAIDGTVVEAQSDNMQAIVAAQLRDSVLAKVGPNPEIGRV